MQKKRFTCGKKKCQGMASELAEKRFTCGKKKCQGMTSELAEKRFTCGKKKCQGMTSVMPSWRCEIRALAPGVRKTKTRALAGVLAPASLLS
ncbi:MAG TPA: hypothetical protein VJN64_16715 [Terriglobales bacterium]|nr:hypothetical protein [Terriglobales bacterium]